MNLGRFEKFERALKFLLPKLILIGGSTVIVMMIGTVREAFGRYVFNMPSLWCVEICENLFVLLIFLGGAHVYLIDGHIRADTLYRKYSGKTKLVINIIIELVVIFYVTILFWQSFVYSCELFSNWSLSSGPLMLPLFPTQVTVTIGAFLLLLVAVLKLFKAIASLSNSQ